MFGLGKKETMCSKCKVKPLDNDMPEKGLCTPCLLEYSRLEHAQFLKGGKIIDKAPENLPDGSMLIPFSMNPPKQQSDNDRPYAVGSELVFHYSDGTSRAVRTTEQEQASIIGKIMDNRRTGRKELQMMFVQVIPNDTVQKMIEIIEWAAEQLHPGAIELLKDLKQ